MEGNFQEKGFFSWIQCAVTVFAECLYVETSSQALSQSYAQSVPSPLIAQPGTGTYKA